MKKKEYQKQLAKEKKELKDLQLGDKEKNIRSVIIITVSVLAFFFLMFAFTKIKTGEWNIFTRKNNTNYTAEIQSTKILCGQVLNRSEKEYFVLAYDISDDTVMLYDSILERYNNASSKLPLYKVDLSNSRNNICKSDKLTISNSVKELKFQVPSLVKVKNGIVVDSYTSYDTIKNTLLSYVD